MQNGKKAIISFCLVFLIPISLFIVNPKTATADSTGDLKKLQDDIKTYQEEIESLRVQEETLETELTLLSKETLESEAEIKATKIRLLKVEEEIEKTEIKIKTTAKQVAIQKETLTDYIRLMNELDQVSLVETLFSSGSLADFMDRLQYTETLQYKTQEALRTYKDLKNLLEDKRKELIDREKEETVLLTQLDAQHDELKRQQSLKERLLEETKGDEERFQELYNEAQQERQQLLVTLITTNASAGKISIQEAKAYASLAEEKTGVRASVLMAVIEQETYFGANVGTGTYKNDMKSQHWAQFEQICTELGIDPEKTPVSKKPASYKGWGGALGPAQIMPYEWVRIKAEVRRLTEADVANPWNPYHAFMGAAIILRGLGAGNQDQEFEAVGRYFAGGYWKKYSWYAESVLRKAKKYE